VGWGFVVVVLGPCPPPQTPKPPIPNPQSPIPNTLVYILIKLNYNK